MEYKICTKCKISKPVTEFFKDKQKKSGTRPDCKACNQARSSKWQKENKDKRRNMELKYLFNITTEEYEALLLKQGGRCAICGSLPNSRRLAVDHDHVTSRIRGLLCTSCNIGLGMLRDDPDLLLRAITYLEQE